ncbi:A-kinase anchor protein 10, mitochondrial-like [Halichondria panicea]|uniref:A-kinase anchor protein 10, mitochondrial-like n=1 Tax=Halichondria panicea TaxID=6063 RepID=UPI00312B375C
MTSKLTSDLCKPLPLVLIDQSRISMLDYFIQFMEGEEAIHLVQFWLSVEAFKATPRRPCDPVTSVPCVGGNCEGVGGDCEGVGGDCEGVRTLDNPTRGASDQAEHTTTVSLGNGVSPLVLCPEQSMADNHMTVTRPGIIATSLSKQVSLSVATDAMEIYTTYIALNALSPVDVPAGIRQKIEVNICPEDGIVHGQCFREAQDFVYHTLESRYYPEFLRSAHLCRYQLEYISSGQLGLLDFLLADNALFYFMEYMEVEGASSLVQFWLMADSFHRQLTQPQYTPDVDVDTRDAIAIYDRFFSLQATEPLGLGDGVRMDIENRICSEHGPSSDSYTSAQERAYQAMSQTHYPDFLRSSIYLRFLNELVHMLNAASLDSPKPHTATHRHLVSHADWRGDIDDPDTIWQRQHLPLRLGFVDQFGMYVSEVEPISKDEPGLFAWIVRRREQEEELTVKIAVNIVSEVMECVKLGTNLITLHS